MRQKLLLAVLAVATPSVGWAHAILVDSTPSAHASMPAGHEAITLRFNSRIDRERSRVTLVAPDKAETRLAVDQAGPADVMTTGTDLQPGSYTLRWQVLAVDGHITRGDVPFTVAAP